MIQIIRANMFKESQQMNENEIQYTLMSVKGAHVIEYKRLERRKLYLFLYQMSEKTGKTCYCKLPYDSLLVMDGLKRASVFVVQMQSIIVN